MAERWLTLADAASRLHVSVRTIERRIQRGELIVRRTPVGREVALDIPETTTDAVSDIVSDIAEQGQRQIQLAGASIGMAQQLASKAEHELRRSRRIGSLAWSLVAVLIMTIGVGVWWTTRTVTLSQARAERLNERSLDLAGRLQAVAAELADTRRGLADANTRMAVMEAERSRLQQDLANTLDAARQGPTTRPALQFSWRASPMPYPLDALLPPVP